MEIDPKNFTLGRVNRNVNGDENIRRENLHILVRNLKGFYKEIGQLVLKPPDVLAIASEPESDLSLQELEKILALIIGCAVECEGKEKFIKQMTELDEVVQTHIKEVLEKTSNVLIFQDLAQSPVEQVIQFADRMFITMSDIIDNRDALSEMVTRLTNEKDLLAKENQNLKLRPLSPHDILEKHL